MMPYPGSEPEQAPQRPGRAKLPAKGTVVACILGLLFALAAWGMGGAFISGESGNRDLASELRSSGKSAMVEDARIRGTKNSTNTNAAPQLELTFTDAQGKVQKGTTYFFPDTVGGAPMRTAWVDQFSGKETIVGAEVRYQAADPSRVMLASEIPPMASSPINVISYFGWVFRGLSLVIALVCVITLIRVIRSRSGGCKQA